MAANIEISSRQLVDIVISALQDKKGLDILFIDFSNIPNTVAKYFVICHGSSSVHVGSLADGVIEKARVQGNSKPWNREGMENAEWILLDYADVVVHVFQESTRKFYNLEALWADMEITKVGDKA
jgi:ribosome-associated protein